MSAIGDAYAEVRVALGAEAADLMPHTATISTPGGPTNQGDGTWAEGAPTTTSGVPCDYKPLSSYERVTGGAVLAGADYALEFPVRWNGAYLNIPTSATVSVDAGAAEPARTFQVVGPLPSDSIWKQRMAATLNA